MFLIVAQSSLASAFPLFQSFPLSSSFLCAMQLLRIVFLLPLLIIAAFIFLYFSQLFFPTKDSLHLGHQSGEDKVVLKWRRNWENEEMKEASNGVCVILLLFSDSQTNHFQRASTLIYCCCMYCCWIGWERKRKKDPGDQTCRSLYQFEEEAYYLTSPSSSNDSFLKLSLPNSPSPHVITLPSFSIVKEGRNVESVSHVWQTIDSWSRPSVPHVQPDTKEREKWMDR